MLASLSRIFPSRLHRLTGLTLVLALSASAFAQIAPQVARTRSAGLDLLIYRTGIREVVTFCGSLPAGDVLAPPDNLAVPTLVGEMLDQGTTRQDKFALAAQLDAVGAELSFSVESTHVVFKGKCLRRDLPLVMRLLAEQLREPAFSDEELAKVKKQIEGSLRRAQENTNHRANQAFAQALYPAGHPNYAPSDEAFLAAVAAATPADLRAFHQSHYGPAGCTLVAVGDVDSAELQTVVAQAFTGWTGGVSLPAFPAATGQIDGLAEQDILMPDKPNISVVLGQTTRLRITDPDAIPLRVATAILGSGFTGRLMATVRDKEGLTYGIGARAGSDTFADGDWRITASFAPALLAQGLASTRRELTAWYEQGVTADELARTKTNLAGKFQVGLATTEGLANALLASVHQGRGPAWLDEYPARLEAVTLTEVNTVIRRRLDPAQMVLIKAGTLPAPAQAK